MRSLVASVAAQHKRSVGLRRSEFLHLARKPVRDERGSVGIPSALVDSANPVGIWVAIRAEKDCSRLFALVVAAIMMFHS